MIVAGKCPPEPEELDAAYERGFNQVELYLEKHHLDEFNSTLKHVRKASVDVVSVHTPHVHLDDKGYVLLADRLVEELDAFMVFHSQYVHHTHIPKLEELELSSSYGYENNPGSSMEYIENSILGRGHQLVFDTAHFYLAHGGDYLRMEKVLEEHLSQIPVIHLNDATPVEDGLSFGAGDMDMERTSKIVSDSGFDGILVLEVMPGEKEEARETFQNYTS